MTNLDSAPKQPQAWFRRRITIQHCPWWYSLRGFSRLDKRVSAMRRPPQPAKSRLDYMQGKGTGLVSTYEATASERCSLSELTYRRFQKSLPRRFGFPTQSRIQPTNQLSQRRLSWNQSMLVAVLSHLGLRLQG